MLTLLAKLERNRYNAQAAATDGVINRSGQCV